MNAGTSTIEWLYSTQLQVDDEWAARTPDGFRWWADQQAQTIEVVGQEAGGPDEATGYFVAVRTELLRGVELDEQGLTALNDAYMMAASLAGVVYDADAGRLNLCSLVRVYDDIADWMKLVISMAAVLQVGEARFMAPVPAEMLGADVARSGHAENGRRPQPDEMAGIIHTLVLPRGQLPAMWTTGEFEEVLAKYMQQPPALLASGGGLAFTVELPWADESSLCQAMTSQPHPAYGNGLLVLQSFPVARTSAAEGIKLALDLNRRELIEEPFGYGLGSYSWGNGMLHFSTFFPNTMYKLGMLPNLYFACTARARGVAKLLTGRDWTGDWFDPAHSAFGRMMGFDELDSL